MGFSRPRIWANGVCFKFDEYMLFAIHNFDEQFSNMSTGHITSAWLSTIHGIKSNLWIFEQILNVVELIVLAYGNFVFDICSDMNLSLLQTPGNPFQLQ